MLNYLRTHAGSWLIKSLLLGIALSFVIGFGILPSVRDRDGEELVVAKIGRRVISRGEWDRAYENLRRFYQEMYKERFTEEMVKPLQLREAALDNLINQALQLEEAKRLNIRVSDEELQERIRTLPYFQRDGVFSRQLYLSLLGRNGISAGEFEKQQRDELRVEKLQQLIRDTVKVSEEELWERYLLEKEEVELTAAKLDPRDFEDAVEVTEERLQSFLQRRQEEFLNPERVRVECVEIDPEAFREQVTVYTGEIEEYYDSHYDEFSHPEEVRLRHILFQVRQDADSSSVEEKTRLLEELRERVRKGEDFALLAGKYSEDRMTAGNGGDLGAVKRGDLVSEVEKAAFSLKAGETSGVIVSPYGLHLLQVQDRREERVDPLEEVKERIREELRNEGAWRLARKKAEEIIWKSKEGADFQAVVQGEPAGVSLRQTGLVARGEPVAGLSGEAPLQEEVFSLQAGQVSQAVKQKNGYGVFRILERQAPQPPPFEEVRARLEEPFRREASRELAGKRAEELAQRLARGEPFEVVAADAGLVPFDAGPVSRLRAFVPQVGSAADLVESAFALSLEKPAAATPFEVNGSYYLVRLKERRTPERSQFLAEEKSFRTRQEQQKKDEVLREWLSDLRRRQQVEIKEIS